MDFGVGGIQVGNGAFPLEQWFLETPVCTRYWTTAIVATSVLVQCKVLSPFDLFFSARSVFNKHQYWRLATSFVYFGPLNLDLAFHLFFLSRYARLLEEASGRSPARFSWLLFFAASFLLCLSPSMHMMFLGPPLVSVLVYVWGRRNPDVELTFLGLFSFKAPFLPWFFMAFGFLAHNSIPKDEICGVIIGHIWYYFNDIYPPTHDDHRPLDPPSWWMRIWEGPRTEIQTNEIPIPENAPAELLPDELNLLPDENPPLRMD